MPTVAPFHSNQEKVKPVLQQRYHNNSICPDARRIVTSGHHAPGALVLLCETCIDLNREGK